MTAAVSSRRPSIPQPDVRGWSASAATRSSSSACILLAVVYPLVYRVLAAERSSFIPWPGTAVLIQCCVVRRSWPSA